MPLTEVAVMLNFIVSGQIPGTPIVLTFQWVLAIASLALGVVIARQITHQNRRNSVVDVEEVTL